MKSILRSIASLFLALFLLPFATQAQTTDITGQWQGTVHFNKDNRFVLKIFKGPDAALKADLYNIDGYPIPQHASSITRDGANIKLSFNLLGLTYTGKLSPDGKTIVGTWDQGNGTKDLTLTLATKETAWDIPAPPAPPKTMPADADPGYDVATIKPNDSGTQIMGGFGVNGRYIRTRATSVEDLISIAYQFQRKQIIGAPEWVSKDRWDIEMTMTPEGAPSAAQVAIITQKLLADRFKLKFHHEKRELSAYVLTVLKDGPKFKKSEINGTLPGFGLMPRAEGTMIPVHNSTMDEFTKALQMLIVDRPVVNQTGLDGRWDFSFTFTPDESQFNGHPPNLPKPADGAAVESAPSIFEAFQNQLGMKLSPEKTQVDVIVIDGIEKPSDN